MDWNLEFLLLLQVHLRDEVDDLLLVPLDLLQDRAFDVSLVEMSEDEVLTIVYLYTELLLLIHPLKLLLKICMKAILVVGQFIFSLELFIYREEGSVDLLPPFEYMVHWCNFRLELLE